MLASFFAVILGISQLAIGSPLQDGQVIFEPPSPELPNTKHAVDEAILAASKEYSDPVAGLLALQPNHAASLAEPRLLHVFGQQQPEWLTEGDKLRLHKQGKKFMDITDHEHFYSQQIEASTAGKACELSSLT